MLTRLEAKSEMALENHISGDGMFENVKNVIMITLYLLNILQVELTIDFGFGYIFI